MDIDSDFADNNHFKDPFTDFSWFYMFYFDVAPILRLDLADE